MVEPTTSADFINSYYDSKPARSIRSAKRGLVRAGTDLLARMIPSGPRRALLLSFTYPTDYRSTYARLIQEEHGFSLRTFVEIGGKPRGIAVIHITNRPSYEPFALFATVTLISDNGDYRINGAIGQIDADKEKLPDTRDFLFLEPCPHER